MNSKHTYCTYFDEGYLARGIVMVESLLRHAPDDRVWILVLGGNIEDLLRNHFGPSVEVVPLERFESLRPDIEELKTQRSRIEYYFTLTAAWTNFVMDQAVAGGDSVTYLDADLFFYESPRSVTELIGDAPVAIVPHRFPRSLRRHRRFGEYNVGWVSFRNDVVGREAVGWWDDRCREWCFDRVEGDKFADQGYLTRFPRLFPGTCVIRDPGVNLAPWNLSGHDVEGPPLTVDGEQLVFYHFHGLRKVGDVYELGLWKYRARATVAVKQGIYVPYIRALETQMRRYGLALSPPREHSGPLQLAKNAFAWLAQDALRPADWEFRE